MLSSLVECGIDVNLRDYDDRSFIDVARDMRNKNMIDHIEKLLGIPKGGLEKTPENQEDKRNDHVSVIV